MFSPFKTILPFFLAALLTAGCTKDKEPEVVSPTGIRGRIMESDAPLLLIHAWATWCQPCLEEFPELVRVYDTYGAEGVELLLVSADSPEDKAAVKAFLASHGAPTDSLITDRLDQEFIESLSPDWAGSLPASFFYSNGVLLKEWEGKRSYEEYAETIEHLLRNQKGTE